MAAVNPTGRVEISGVVFLDANGNGEYDDGETPLAGIYVSNGEEIVTTDANGQYRLPSQTGSPSCVFVIVPNGYRCSGEFFRVSPSAGERTHAFGLIEDQASLDDTFAFIHGADIQYSFVNDPKQLAYDMRSMEALADRYDARFYAVAGDLTSSGKEENLSLLMREMTGLKRPFHAGFGGHDALELYYAKAPSSMSRFVDIMGPYAYAWNYGGVHFVAITTETYFLNAEENARQLRWLEKDIALVPRDQPLILMCHTPEHMNREITEIGKTHNLKAILRGHWHIHDLFMVGDIPVFGSAPWRSLDWGAFTKKCRIITYDNGTLSSFTRVLNQEKRLAIVAPQGKTLPGGTQIVANVYDTLLQPSTVEYELTTTDGTSLTGHLTQMSDFSWAADIAANLPPGKGTVLVRARAGEHVWEKTGTFEVQDTAGPACASDKDWPSIFGPAPGRRSVAGKLKPPLFLRWVAHTGHSLYYFSSPVIHEGRLYLGLSDGQAAFRKAGVICLDAATGEPVWRTRLEDDIHATTAALGDSVYAMSNTGMLHRLNAETGELIWARDANEGSKRNPYASCMTMAPLNASGEHVYAVASGSNPACFDAISGTKVWGPVKVISAVYPRAGLCTGDGRGYVADEAKCVALDLQDGSVLWEQEAKRERGITSPVFHDGSVYFHKQRTLRKLDARDGSVTWEYAGGQGINYVGMPAINADGTTVVVTFDRSIVGVNAETGEERWRFNTPSPGALAGAAYQTIRNGSSPAISGNFVYVASDNGMFYVLDIATGSRVWQYAIGVPIKSSPALSGNMVYITAFDGNVYAFSGTPDGPADPRDPG